MKKLILIAIAAIAFTTATQAQDSTSHKKMKMDRSAKMQHAQMFDELNLTQDQKDKMKQIREDNMTKMSAIKNDASLNDTQRQEKIKDLRLEQKKNMETILTDDQKAKMKQLRQEHMKDRKDMGTDSTMRK